MISQRQIERLLSAGQFQQLVKRVLVNGRCANPPVVRLMTDAAAVEPIAIGLALQRLSELWCCDNGVLDCLANRLMGLRSSDGSLGALRLRDSGSRIAATAVAVRAWLCWLDTAHERTDCAMRDRVECCAKHALESIRIALQVDGSIERNPAGWAVVISQLGDRAEFREVADVPEMISRLERCAGGAMPRDLLNYACAMAA